MVDLIDIHTHILPGLDDGASSDEDALQLARAAHEEGITTIIATPHHANGVYLNAAAEVTRHVQALNEKLVLEGLPVTLFPGQEIRVHDDLLDAWHRGELLSLAGSKYVLLEMPSSRIPQTMGDLVHELGVMGLKPIIAHPERNAEVVSQPERLEELLDLGAYAQVTTHSLLGGFGKRIEQSAWTLLKRGSIHIVSSDAHHVERRGFRLAEAYSAIDRVIGREWSDYLQANASAVALNESFDDQPRGRPAQQSAVRKLFSFFQKK